MEDKDGKRSVFTIGVDLGGTNTQCALVDGVGQIVDLVSFKTRDYPHIEDFVKRLSEEVENLCRKVPHGATVKGIGIGAPCVNSRMRSIDGATDLPWKGTVPLADLAEAATGLPVAMANDANAAAIGEMTYGCAKGMTDFIVLTLGTGVGSGIVCDGRVINGRRGFAGELGHATFPFAADRVCGCGRRGCLQTVCSSKGIITTALRLMEETDLPSVLRNVPPGELTCKAIGDAKVAGDELASRVIRFTEEALGRACAEFAVFADPEAIILFGGAANPEEMSADHIREIMEENMLCIYKGKVKILFSQLQGADAAILGAASLPRQCTPTHL